jgi:hypothetical protein
MQCSFQFSEVLNPAASSTYSDNNTLAAEPETSAPLVPKPVPGHDAIARTYLFTSLVTSFLSR